MPHSYQALFAHFVFSTRDRDPIITPDWREHLFGQIARTAKDRGQLLLASGGVDDHVHLLVSMSRSVAPSDFAREVKAASSQWVHRHRELPDFAWQTGYAVFSVSKSNCGAVAAYIARQEEHHLSQSFQDEFRALLEKHGVEYDERYLWD